jgi:hypothetical protein
MKRSHSVVAAACGLAMACGLALSGCGGGSASSGGSAGGSTTPAASGGAQTDGKVSCPAVSEINSTLALHDKGPSMLKVSDGSILCLYTAASSGGGSANVVLNTHETKAGFASAKAQFAGEKSGHLSDVSGLGDQAVSFVTSSISVDAVQGTLFVHAAANGTSLAKVESLVRHLLQTS